MNLLVKVTAVLSLVPLIFSIENESIAIGEHKSAESEPKKVFSVCSEENIFMEYFHKFVMLDSEQSKSKELVRTECDGFIINPTFQEVMSTLNEKENYALICNYSRDKSKDSNFSVLMSTKENENWKTRTTYISNIRNPTCIPTLLTLRSSLDQKNVIKINAAYNIEPSEIAKHKIEAKNLLNILKELDTQDTKNRSLCIEKLNFVIKKVKKLKELRIIIDRAEYEIENSEGPKDESKLLEKQKEYFIILYAIKDFLSRLNKLLGPFLDAPIEKVNNIIREGKTSSFGRYNTELDKIISDIENTLLLIDLSFDSTVIWEHPIIIRNDTMTKLSNRVWVECMPQDGKIFRKTYPLTNEYVLELIKTMCGDSPAIMQE
ncbi:hypothetical protein NEMIN01_1028 [Nematocida minor]|uniref:uncharacterized protein n=1 Tax=Nematocida minor TaxID=1912983 RepID=UPI00221E4065|nr:uncharacterized protein NEMIN01_1028 [Nematocida minor]KAI5190404.1 hypothetical protein NEMIN01_1028 [Nematocida minor]